jgi:hypothetical protein
MQKADKSGRAPCTQGGRTNEILQNFRLELIDCELIFSRMGNFKHRLFLILLTLLISCKENEIGFNGKVNKSNFKMLEKGMALHEVCVFKDSVLFEMEY